jgi:hypothetical protein
MGFEGWCNIAPKQLFGRRAMPRQSISFSPPNDDWLKAQVEIEVIRARLIHVEHSGFTNEGQAEILAKAKAKAKAKEQARRNGAL